jgi:hypothetical protein
MEFTSNGRVVRGIAGVGVYIDEIRLKSAGSGMPSVADDIIYYLNSDLIHNCRPDGTNDNLIYNNKTSLVYAAKINDNYVWAAWVNGVTTSWGLHLPDAVLLGMSKSDGSILVGTNYQSGIGLTVYAFNSLTPKYNFPEARPALWFPYPQAWILSLNEFIWVEGGVNLRGSIDVQSPGVGIYHPELLVMDNRYWLLYGRHDDSIVLHAINTPKFGYYWKGPALAPRITPDKSAVVAALNSSEIHIVKWNLFLFSQREIPPVGGSIPIPDPPKPDNPEPEEPKLPAPNKIETVRRMMRLHKDINLLDDNDRGRILDLVCNAEGGPWGRKSKNQEGTDLNTDVLAYKFGDDTMELIDVIAGSDPNPSNPDRGKFATWDTDHKRWKQGDNGFWVPAKPVNGTQPKPEEPSTPGKLPPNVHPISYPAGYVGPKNLGDWILNEFPQLVQAYKDTHDGNDPNYEWAAFQTCRRYGAGLPPGEPAWTLEKMLKHEKGQ